MNLFLVIFKISVWFFLGLYLYCSISKTHDFINLKRLLFKSSFLELWLFFYLIYYLWCFTLQIFTGLNFIEFIDMNSLRLEMNLVDDSSANSGNSSSNEQISSSTAKEQISSTNEPSAKEQSSNNQLGRAGDGAIMTAALAGGFKVAQKVPHLTGKLATVAGSIIAGAGAIVIKNIAGNLIDDLGKKDFISIDLNLNSLNSLNEIFGLTGNSVIDLLKMIQFFQHMQIWLLFLIFYYLIILFVKDSTIEYTLKILPDWLKEIIMKSIKKFRKSGKIIVYFLIILLICCIFIANHYFDFFFINLEENMEKIYKIFKEL
uniref:Uncharacterized protein n=1 Tax=Clavaria fumosa TaxID=264083 RepID=A0A7T3PCP9_9AGAR|nr:hypothetical protein KQ422_mgp120 [Clavaria fumosa]QPZ51080.1 hypothetical protein [Clavaria fumosa]